MSDVIPDTEAATESGQDAPPSSGRPNRGFILLLVVALLCGVALSKMLSAAGRPSASGSTSLTAVHNDALGDFEAARRTGRPIYLLFHSLS